MSVSAGRVLIIPKGNYNPTETYTMLDMVQFNSTSYLCIKTCTGIQPTDTEYWYCVVDLTVLMNKIGDLDELKTSSKASLVDALNEIFDSIPKKTSDLQNDSGFIDGVDWGDIGGTLANQTDLNNALSGKASASEFSTLVGKIGSIPQGETVEGQIDDLANEISDVSNITAKPWDQNKTYTAGEYCTNAGKYWKCKVQNSGQTPSEGTYWTNSDIGEELGLLNQRLTNELADKIFIKEFTGAEYGAVTVPANSSATIELRNADIPNTVKLGIGVAYWSGNVFPCFFDQPWRLRVLNATNTAQTVSNWIVSVTYAKL